MTRLFVAATAFLALLAVTSEEANALTSSTRRCIAQKRDEYRNALRSSRAFLLNDFRGKYAQCFGPGEGCAQDCQVEQSNCQEGPNTARAKCVNDVDERGVDTDPAFLSCRNIFDRDIIPCQDEPDDTKAETCAKGVRLARFDCTQQCAKDQQAALDQCNFVFGDCVQACASRR